MLIYIRIHEQQLQSSQDMQPCGKALSGTRHVAFYRRHISEKCSRSVFLRWPWTATFLKLPKFECVARCTSTRSELSDINLTDFTSKPPASRSFSSFESEARESQGGSGKGQGDQNQPISAPTYSGSSPR
eukprot:6211769-Pleurochrysis_carterae.AAC.6